MSSRSRDDDFDTRSERRPAAKLDGQPNFGPRYKVLAKVGEGGMGEVFRAYDAELKGEVALKVVRADKDDAPAAFERFRREVALARKVTSPNVLRVYDLDDHEGLRFLSMELVEGSDLAAVMRAGRLPIERALAIFRQVCAGLAAAHEQGVVHRDLKPQNVLVDREDHVKVADFGLARSIGDSGMTVTGAVLGSPAYMSPEQVKGEPTDERSDIYSLGIMLYQLISGETPFRGGTPHAVMEMRLHKAPKPLHELEPATPRAVDAVAAKCLAVSPAARYATIKELLAALDTPGAKPAARRRWLVPAIVGGLVLAGGIVAVIALPGSSSTTAHGGTAPGERPPALRTQSIGIVLVRGENLSGDPLLDNTLEWVIQEELRGSPGLEPWYGWRASDLVSAVSPDGAIDVANGRKLAAAQKTGVVIVDAISKLAGSSYSISVTATDVSDGRVVLQRTLNVPKARIVHDIVVWTRDLRRALGESLPPDSAPDPDLKGEDQLVGMHELAIGRALLATQDEQLAIPHLEEAVNRYPTSAATHRALAIAYYNVGRFADSNEQSRQALKLADGLNERDRLNELGDYDNMTTGDYESSIAAYTQVLQKWPRDLTALSDLSNMYLSTHQIARAIEAGRRTLEMYPHDSIARSNIAGYEIAANRLDDASRDLDQLERDSPHFPGFGYEYRAIIAGLRGQFDEAAAAAVKIAGDEPSRSEATIADLLLAQAKVRDAIDVLTRGIAADVRRGDSDNAEAKQAVLGDAWLRLGDKKRALAAASKPKKELAHQFLSALVQLGAGERTSPLAAAERLSREAPPIPRAFAHALNAEAARLSHGYDHAIEELHAAIALDDGWIYHFMLARTLFDAKRLNDAESELAVCMKRRGEGAFVFLDDVATLHMLPPVTYWRARVQEAQGKPEAKATYAEFLKDQSTADHDPLVDDAQKRMAALH